MPAFLPEFRKNRCGRAGDKIQQKTAQVERKVGTFPGMPCWLKDGDLAGKKAEMHHCVIKILSLHQDIQQATDGQRKTDKAVKEMKSKLRKMTTQLEEEKAKAVDRSSVSTPQPDWREAQMAVEKVMDLKIEKATDEVVSLPSRSNPRKRLKLCGRLGTGAAEEHVRFLDADRGAARGQDPGDQPPESAR